MLAIFCVNLIGSGFAMVGFASVSPIIIEVYDTSPLVVNACFLVFLASFVPMNFVVMWSTEKYGLRANVIVGGLVGILGCWVRQLVNGT